MPTKTVLLGSIYHETNTFAPGYTTREDFQDHKEYFGDEIIEEFHGTNTEIGGIINLAEQSNINLFLSLSVSAMPGATIARDTFDFYQEKLLSDIRQHKNELDGVILPLHGAMVVEGLQDGEGVLISNIREIIEDHVPIIVTLDLHGNITDKLVHHADALIAYETYPHIDKAKTGKRGLDCLLQIIHGEIIPVMSIERPPLSPVTPTQNTREGPMAEVMEFARKLEEQDSIVKVNVLPGFSRSDVPAMGFSVPVVADDDLEAAKNASRDLAEMVWEMHEEFVMDFPTPPEAVSEAIDYIEGSTGSTDPVVLADVGDNPGGGGTADGTAVLRELIEQGADNTGVAIIRDPAVVESCIQSGVGKKVTVTLGGKTDDRHGEPIVDLDGYVKTITDGKFLNYGPKSTGAKNDMGRTVLLECQQKNDVQIIVTEKRLQPADTEIWRHVGTQPERFDILLVKSTNHFRADYEPRASRVIPVNSPGLAAMDPRQFNHRNLKRQIYPICEEDEIQYPN
ncbi:M81 family metallopeptidase [Halostagnicola larsenii]|uniref:M81 family metallopeptidase n=1 Tax=Halostagnicola larsenii TaxID=353800 RepID=UPI0012FB6731|nr:M81 family metallopeptidase [Halostagnicola larsenii]